MANKIVLILSIVGALLFLFAGVAKLVGAEQMTDNLEDNLNVPGWAIPVIGAIEVVGAVLLLVPKTRFWGAAGLTLVAIGAFATHVIHADWAGMAVPAVLGLIVAFVAWKTMPADVRAKIGGRPA